MNRPLRLMTRLWVSTKLFGDMLNDNSVVILCLSDHLEALDNQR